jgi:hypothetical protein
MQATPVKADRSAPVIARRGRKEMSGWDRLGLVLTVGAFVFLSAYAWLEPHWYQQELMDRCDAQQEARLEMLKDKNWDPERILNFRDQSRKFYSECLDGTIRLSNPHYQDRLNPVTYVYLLFIALVFVLLPYWIVVSTVRWVARGFTRDVKINRTTRSG